MAEYRFVLPDLGEGVGEGEITAWLIAEGQEVSEDAPMVEVETDKATVEIPCPVDGVVRTLHAAPGERVTVGSLIVTFDDDQDGSAAGDGAAAAVSPPMPYQGSSPAARLPGGASVRATPAARRLARELGVELTALTGTGPHGAITDRDVRAAADDRAAPEAGERREPLRGVRRRIAERLSLSQREIPKVTVVEECDFTELAARRGDLSYTPFVVKAVVSALHAFPEFNSTLDGEEIVYHDRYDIGVAAQGPKGLLVPVIRAADTKSLEQISQDAARLASAVKDDTIGPEDLRGGTFTVTLAGKLGGLFATPLVNPGEAAILGVHRIGPRPAVVDGEIAIRQSGLVSCSFDHRITDGTRATMFLLHVIDLLQSCAGL